jgi:hypothetical protein
VPIDTIQYRAPRRARPFFSFARLIIKFITAVRLSSSPVTKNARFISGSGRTGGTQNSKLSKTLLKLIFNIVLLIYKRARLGVKLSEGVFPKTDLARGIYIVKTYVDLNAEIAEYAGQETH